MFALFKYLNLQSNWYKHHIIKMSFWNKNTEEVADIYWMILNKMQVNE